MTQAMEPFAKETHGDPADLLDARVVLLTHYIPLYQVRVFQEIAAAVRDFHVLLSTPLEPNRHFDPDWGGLDVRVQKNITLRRRWRDRGTGFDDQLYVHLPYDTLSQLRRLKPDIVLSLELGARSLAAAIYRTFATNSRLVLCTYMSEHTESSRGSLRRRLRGPLLRRADAVTYNGPSCRRYLKQHGVAAAKLFPLPYAADDRTVYRGPVERDEAVVRGRMITVGQLSERKGILRLVSDLSDYVQLKEKAIELTIVGEGPLREALQSVSLPAGLKIELTGNQSPVDLARAYSEHGVAVLPTLADEWLLVVNEAMQAGLPLIGSVYAQGVTTLLSEGNTGWQYDPLRRETLFAALDRYFACSDEAIAAMRREARSKIAERTPRWAAAGAIEAMHSVLKTHPIAPETA